MSSSLVLRELQDADESAFLAGLAATHDEEPGWYSFAWKPGMTYAQMMQILRDEVAGTNLAPGRVRHTMLYAFLDNKIIGRLSVRHALNENLRRRGGHIGYWVLKNFRRQGHATEMVGQGLDYCRGLGLTSIMVSCADDNEPSCRLIERYGGILEDKVWDAEDKETIRRYWIELR